MRKASFADMYCSVAQTLEVIGEWWTLLILRDVFLGVRRFDDFVERLGISRNILTNRLETLVATGILFTSGVVLFLWDFFFLAPRQRTSADTPMRTAPTVA